jgi:hypothetical protein
MNDVLFARKLNRKELKRMPDISMCNILDCDLKENCLRYISVPNKYGQSFLQNPKDDCERDGHKLFIEAKE